MALVKDASTKKFVIKALDEELKELKYAYNTGRFTREQFNIRKKRISEKKKQVRAGKYDL